MSGFRRECVLEFELHAIALHEEGLLVSCFEKFIASELSMKGVSYTSYNTKVEKNNEYHHRSYETTFIDDWPFLHFYLYFSAIENGKGYFTVIDGASYAQELMDEEDFLQIIVQACNEVFEVSRALLVYDSVGDSYYERFEFYFSNLSLTQFQRAKCESWFLMDIYPKP